MMGGFVNDQTTKIHTPLTIERRVDWGAAKLAILGWRYSGVGPTHGLIGSVEVVLVCA
jgi:hypothetical protein